MNRQKAIAISALLGGISAIFGILMLALSPSLPSMLALRAMHYLPPAWIAYTFFTLIAILGIAIFSISIYLSRQRTQTMTMQKPETPSEPLPMVIYGTGIPATSAPVAEPKNNPEKTEDLNEVIANLIKQKVLNAIEKGNISVDVEMKTNHGFVIRLDKGQVLVTSEKSEFAKNKKYEPKDEKQKEPIFPIKAAKIEKKVEQQ
jgi:hypothetical protein